MYKSDLALNNQQWLICHKTKPNQTYNLWLLYHKPFNKGKQDMFDTAGEVRTNSLATFFYGLLHMVALVM